MAGLIDRLLRWRHGRTDVAAVERAIDYDRLSSPMPVSDAEFDQAVEVYRLAQYERAVERFEAIITSKHDYADAHYYLGLALYHLARFAEACDAFTMASCFAPKMAKAYLALAHCEHEQGNTAAALTSIEQTLCHEQCAAAFNLKGTLLLETGDVEGALASFASAINVEPDGSLGHSNLGYVLCSELGEYERGRLHIERALQLDPNSKDALCNYTMVLSHFGDYDRAMALCDRLLSETSDMHEARLNRALLLLQLGRFERAWEDYEARKFARCSFSPRSFPCPEWRGEDLGGKTILVYGEQGLGDEIMFASCFDDISKRAGRCVIECEPRLESLFRRSFPRAVVYAGRQVAATPEWWSNQIQFDFHVPAGSLPRHFRTDRSAFPKHNGYLVPASARVAHWRERLAALGPGLKVGISWRGGKRSTRRDLRSIDLAAWHPLWQCQGARFVNLQYGDTAAECEQFVRDNAVELHTWREAIDNLDETAALIAGLDLVISVCTAVIHLTGAIGRPLWVLVPTCPEWRYLAAGRTMPWYPSARLIRQQVAGDWREVLSEVAQRLQEFQAGPTSRQFE
jgi:Flp pilus assembly protein TadD